MKNIRTVINHFFEQPQYKKYNQAKCVFKFLQIFPPSIKEGVDYAYIKNNILHLALNNPNLKTEFYYKKTLIKGLLIPFSTMRSKCKEFAQIEDVVIFISPRQFQNEEDRSLAFYEERAMGCFEICTKNKRIKQVFEEIKELVQNSVY